MTGAADYRHRFGVDWSRQSAWPAFPLELDGWTAICRRNAPDSPDDAALFMAATVAAIMARTAAGRDGLTVLQDFLAPDFKGFSTAAMIRRGMEWTHLQAKRRAASLRRLGHAARDVAAVLRDHPGVDPADLAADVEEAGIDLASRRKCPQSAMPLCIGLWTWAPPVAAVKAWRRMLSAFRSAYPWRERPLATPRAVRAERDRLARGVKS